MADNPVILVSGPECSGKTSLCQALTAHFGGSWLPEYAVTYLDRINRPYIYSDLLEIAKSHVNHFEKKLVESREGDPVFLDSFLLNLKIWSLYRFGRVDPWINDALQNLHFDLVLLLFPNISWESAPYRENPEDRDYLFKMYRDEMDLRSWNYHVIDGLGDQRLHQSKRLVDKVLAKSS